MCVKAPNTMGRRELGEDWIPAYAGMTEKEGDVPRPCLFPSPPGEGQGEGKKPSAQSLNNSKNPLPHQTVHATPLFEEHKAAGGLSPFLKRKATPC